MRDRSTRTLLPLAAVAGDALRLSDGSLRAVLECPTLAFGIKGEAEQRAVVDGWAALLNSLSHSLEVLIRVRQFDGAALPGLPESDDPARAALRASYRQLLDTLAEERRLLDRRFFVVVPWDPPIAAKASARDEGLAVLDQRVRWISESLRRIDLEPRRLVDRELVTLLRRTLDPATATQPVDASDSLLDVAELVAPAAFTEQTTAVSVSERAARTVAVSRYPARLQLGWLGDLHGFAGDLDVALHLHPSAGPAVMAFLERRIAELSSTVSLSERHGGRADPYRRAALRDALELQDRIAQGSERLFDASLYLTVWAAGTDALERATGRIEALLGARLIHTRRLFYQMRAGLIATLPLCYDRVRVRRVLSTTALSATFPFTGSDLSTRDGLLYGVNTATRSPVVLDRFALENHNAVVFATSGAGKSYLVKVELTRAALAGVRTLVIDPEGEYAPLLAPLGVAVRAIGPGGGAGLDPFALADGAPGSLSSRIATLTTLLELLAGGLQPPERAALEEALSMSYAHTGFVDGGAIGGLVPPRLADVQQRLRGHPAMDGVARRLERFVTGAGAWVFRPGATAAPAAAGTVYVLAGLPEELRAAAMFLVLDRIWADLARSTGPTFVVVDEAWWLMRHPDTAAFLFRLIKTARKRHAGLTLITQDVGDVLASPDGEPLIANAALQILMKQAPQAMPRLAELFRLTRAEQSWLLGAQRGEGLLLARGKRVPFAVVATEEEARRIADRERAG
jgi:Helicase HerA, central domain/TraG P-loop domain